MTEPTGATTVTPNAADNRPRTQNGQAVINDPEAPHGWMVDPKTGERRPKKRPGRQSTKPPVDAPHDRPSGKTRTTKAKAARKPEQEYVKPVSDLTEAVWMILAAAPSVETKVLGIDLGAVSIRLKATASVLKEEAPSVVAGVSKMAAHSDVIAKGVNKLSEESGPAWVLPAMFALLPFVAQTASIWKSPVKGDVEAMANKTEKEWSAFLDEMMRREPEEPAQPRADIAIRPEPNDSTG